MGLRILVENNFSTKISTMLTVEKISQCFSGTRAQDFEVWAITSNYVKLIILKLFSIVISFVRVAEIIGE